MKTIDSLDLGKVCGGAGPTRSQVVLNKLDGRFGSQGVVSFSGKPKFTGTHNGVEHVTGKFNTNALWGGNVKRSFDGHYNPSTGKVTDMHTHIIGGE
jgi:hypothetical protein